MVVPDEDARVLGPLDKRLVFLLLFLLLFLFLLGCGNGLGRRLRGGLGCGGHGLGRGGRLGLGRCDGLGLDGFGLRC